MIAWTTVEEEADGRKLASGLLEAKLAACVHLEGPITAFYTWEGKQEEGKEYRLMVKFPASKAEAIKAWIRAHHPYDTPQWIAVDVADVTEGYKEWVGSVA